MSEDSILNMDFGELMNNTGGDPGAQKPEEGSNNESKESNIPNIGSSDDVNSFLADQLNDDSADKEENNTNNTSDESNENEESDKTERGENENTDESPASTNNTDDTSSDPFTLIFARHQLEQGNISSLDEEELKKQIDENGEDGALTWLMNQELESRTSSAKDEYDKYAKEYAELREVGIDPETAQNMTYNHEVIDNISEEQVEAEDSEDLRKEILSQHFKATTNFSDDRINKLVKRSIDLGEDVDDAKSALTELKDIYKQNADKAKEEAKNAELQRQEQLQNSLKSLKDKIDGTDEILKGRKINKQTKSKIEQMLTKPVKTNDRGQALNAIWAEREKDPISFDTKVAYFMSMGLFDGKADVFDKNAKTKATQSLKEVLNSRGSNYIGGKAPTAGGNSRDLSDNMLKSMKKLF